MNDEKRDLNIFNVGSKALIYIALPFVILSLTSIDDPPSDASAAFGHPTEVSMISPVAQSGQLRTNYHIVSTTHAQCYPGSHIVSAPVYYCDVLNQRRDPCWLIGRLDSARHYLACVGDPWSNTVTRVEPEGKVEATHGTTRPSLGFPWAVRLSSGTYCLVIPSGNTPIDGTQTNFSCSPGHLYLLGYPKMGTKEWSFRSATVTKQNVLKKASEVSVDRAYYAV